MSTNKFGKRICKLLAESNRETFIGYVLGATDDLLIYAISAELYLDILIFCSHVLLQLSEKQWTLVSTPVCMYMYIIYCCRNVLLTVILLL